MNYEYIKNINSISANRVRIWALDEEKGNGVEIKRDIPESTLSLVMMLRRLRPLWAPAMLHEGDSRVNELFISSVNTQV